METINAFGGKFVTRAPKGGFDHPANGKPYRGGQFCPLYSVSGGSEEATPSQIEFVNLLGETVSDLGDGPYGAIYQIIYYHDNARVFARSSVVSLQERAVVLKEQARNAWTKFRELCPIEEQPRRIGEIYHREAAEWGF